MFFSISIFHVMEFSFNPCPQNSTTEVMLMYYSMFYRGLLIQLLWQCTDFLFFFTTALYLMTSSRFQIRLRKHIREIPRIFFWNEWIDLWIRHISFFCKFFSYFLKTLNKKERRFVTKYNSIDFTVRIIEIIPLFW